MGGSVDKIIVDGFVKSAEVVAGSTNKDVDDASV